MLLQRLAELARDERLIDRPNYKPGRVDYIVHLSRDGLVVEIEDRNLDKSVQSQKISIPTCETVRTVQNIPCFIVDKAEYSFGLEKKDERNQANMSARCKTRHMLYTALVNRAASETNDEGLLALRIFLSKILPAGIQIPENMNSESWIAFSLDRKLISDNPSAVKWWEKYNAPEGDADFQCVVCGNACSPVRLHDKASVPGGQASLVSFDNKSSAHFGMEKGDNAPTCQSCMKLYTIALTRLLSKNYPNPSGVGAMPCRYIWLSQDKKKPLVAVFWSPLGNETFDLLLRVIMEGDVESVKSLYGAPWKGRMVNLQDPSSFFCLILGWNDGRMVVRSYYQTTLNAAAKNIAQHFHDLGLPQEELEKKPLNLFHLVACLEKEVKHVHTNLMNQVFSAVVNGVEYPPGFLISLINVINKSHFIGRTRGALLRAVLVRQTKEAIPRMLDESYMNTGYRLGRLFAILARLQKAVIWNIQRTIVDSHYSTAASTPSLAFPRLMHLAQAHIKKSRYRGYFNKLIGAILGPMDAEAFPNRLSMEDQGKFALGYYHQREWFFRSRKDRDADSDAETDPDDFDPSESEEN